MIVWKMPAIDLILENPDGFVFEPSFRFVASKSEGFTDSSATYDLRLLDDCCGRCGDKCGLFLGYAVLVQIA